MSKKQTKALLKKKKLKILFVLYLEFGYVRKAKTSFVDFEQVFCTYCVSALLQISIIDDFL